MSHPKDRFADASIEGVAVHPQTGKSEWYKVVRDKDGKDYAQGARFNTSTIERVNRREQSRQATHVEVQTTLDEELAERVPAELKAEWQSASTAAAGDPTLEITGSELVVNHEELCSFLRRVTPLMQKELGLSWHSMPVFDAYEPLWGEVKETCELTHQVWKEGISDLQVAAVTWNTTGATLACSYGKLDTLGWCDVQAPVCLWNIFRPRLAAGEPDTVIQVQGFVMCLAFHPSRPGTLAGGTYNGELLIWNTASSDLDPLVAASSIDDYFHREAIQAVEWIPADLSGGADAYIIATVSGDGKVLIWDARENDLSYPSRGFMLLGAKKHILGGRSLSFSPLDPWLFVVGCETGIVMRAFRPPPGASMGKPTGQYAWKPSAVALLDQLSGNSRLQLQHHVEGYCRTSGAKEVTAEVMFRSKPDPSVIFPAPKTTDLESHAGPVVVATFSPFHRKLLLTGSIDGTVKLFDVLSQRALRTFFPPSKHLSTCAVSAAAWSLARPCVFAVAMEMGGVYVYDLLRSKQEPVMELPLIASGSQKVTCLAFNPKQRGLLAVGDDSCRVRIFRLPFELSEQKKNEAATISLLLGDRSRQKEEEKVSKREDRSPKRAPP